MTKRKALLFDLDGTLWDSAEGVAKSWQLAAKEMGITIHKTAEDIRGYMGWPMDEIRDDVFANVEDPKEREAAMDLCSLRENEILAEEGGVLFDHELETLEELSKNWFLGIVSNCQDGYIDAFLQAHNLKDTFDDFACWQDTKKEKAYNIRMVLERNGFDLDRDEVYYIGDTVKDQEAAEKAGVPFIHAAYGFGRCRNTFVLDAIENLPALLKTIENR
jgi:phosphoglycolate phosphatase